MTAEAAGLAPDPARGPWVVQHVMGTVAALHEASAELAGTPLSGRLARVHHPSDAAVVLGSAQRVEEVDRRAAEGAGLAVVRRRSGGGAVLVVPGELCWVDLLIPRADPLWDDDVGRAAWWVGRCWASALTAMGIGPATAWQGRLVTSRWSGRVCFAGLGPGEVRVGARKVVGLSQRRTRHAALFQCMAALRWDPGPLLGVLALDPAERQEAAIDLAALADGIGPDRGDALVTALLATLPG